MNLRRTIFGVLTGAAALALVAAPGANAQIYSEFTPSIQSKAYQPQTSRGTVLTRNQFHDLFAPTVVDADDGVAGPIALPFPFEYNGQVYTQIYICVNGWISFRAPSAFLTDNPYSLFDASPPNLTVAPYFGNHYLRTPGFDLTDPQGRAYTPSTIRVVSIPGVGSNPGSFVIEWENLNINYRFDPLDPNNPLAPVANVKPQATSVGTFQCWLTQAPSGSQSLQGDIEFHYGPVGASGIVKVSGASVGIEDEPSIPGGQTTFINAVAFRESGGNLNTAITDTRLTTVWPPTGFPGQIFKFTGNRIKRLDNWGDGDADLTQIDPTLPQFITTDQRRFVTFLDAMRILRHTATSNVAFDSTYGRNGFHGDVNHNGRFYYSTRNYDNTADSLDQFLNIVRYKVLFPTKSTNYQTPFPGDNSFTGFLFDANQQDAALIMLYLAAKLPALPWLPDTLPAFTGKAAVAAGANDVVISKGYNVNGRTVEIPVRFNGSVSGAMGVALEAAKGTRIIDVKPMERTETSWVETASSEDRVAIATAGSFNIGDVIATVTVEAAPNGDVTFENVTVGDEAKGLRKFNAFGAADGQTGALSLQNSPNPFTVGSTTVIGYTLPADGKVTVRIFDVLGREVRTLVDGVRNGGSYNAEWNGLDAAGKPVESGVYYCRIDAAGQSRTISMQVQK